MYSEIATNKRKTFLMFVVFALLAGGLSWVLAKYLGEPVITPFVLLGSAIYALVSYFAATKLALAINGAHEIKRRDNPRLYRIVENLSITEGMPMPRVYVMDEPALNAFATGRNPANSVVCATTGLLDTLNDNELEGVMAHELAHIKNYDIRVSIAAFALVAVVSLLSDIIIRFTWFRDSDSRQNNQYIFLIGIFAAILAPIAAKLIQLSISRKREFLADATGAFTTRYPEGLASALEKIKNEGSTLRKQHTSTAHLFFENPLEKSNITRFFSTHPPITERISKLRKMGTKL